MKTIFTVLLATMSIITLSGYPFAPNQTFFLELFIIGLSSILLALEPNDKRIRGSFLKTVVIKSVPNALAMFIPVIVIMAIEKSSSLSLDCRNAIAMCVVTAVGYLNLIHICRPFTKWRAGVVISIGALLAAIIPTTIFFLDDMFNFHYIAESYTTFSIMIAVGIVCALVMNGFSHRIQKAMEKKLRDNKFKKKSIHKKFFRG
jgi:cation-transporting ATPase E